jgi:EAL domain-containing protein (putative c-di-GMP-specific phosphodiesterase class I)
VAEETGLIAPLGEWILRQACQQLRHWRSAGHPDMRVAVNVSPHQFRNPEFATSAQRILRETDVPAEAVELELTEGTLMMRTPENAPILEQLVTMGMQLAQDDFGTGYSSLSNLQRYPVHTLKIDSSIIGAIGRDQKGSETVAAIIAMAHEFNLKVVAEGVETAEQAAFLKAQHCEAAQGFYFSEPMAPGMLQERLNVSGGDLKLRASTAQ